MSGVRTGRHVAIVGPDFLPSSLPPALRIRLFATHLAEFGWRVTVVTVAPEFYEQRTDPAMSALLPASVDVVRTWAVPARLTRLLRFGDLGLRSVGPLWAALARLCRQRPVDLVFLPVPPFVPMVLGRLARARFGIPYVVDYIDPWLLEGPRAAPAGGPTLKRRLAAALARTLEPFTLRRVAHVVGVSPGTVGGVVARHRWLSREQATDIPYGGEPADFDHVRRHPRRNPVFTPGDGFLHASYVGAYTEALEGALRALLAGVRAAREDGLEGADRLRLHFVGTSYAAGARARPVTAIARQLGVETVVEERPERVAYLDALQVMLDSDALLIVGSDEPHYTPSKVFPSVLARRPVLALLHEACDAADLLERTGSGPVLRFKAGADLLRDPGTVAAALAQVLARREEIRPGVPSGFEPSTARAMTARLAAVFDRVAGGP